MFRQSISVIMVPLVLLVAACSEPASEVDGQSADAVEPEMNIMPETADATMHDPVVVDPDHYSVEFENDAVRVLRINYGAGEESVMHFHPDSVAVYLGDIEAQFTLPDGSVEDASAPAGSIFFGPAGAHQPRNLGDSAFEVIEVELKARESSMREPGGPDPTVVDADHYTVEFENDAVRVLRIAYDPGEESVMHYHPDGVALFLTDHVVEMDLPDGSVEELSAAAGDVAFAPGGQHLPRNVADSPVQVVLIELQ